MFTTGSAGGNVTIDFTNLTFNPDITMGQQIEALMLAAGTPCSIPSYLPYSACGSGSTGFSITSAVTLDSNTTYYVQINGANTGAGVTQPAQCNFDITLTGDVVYYWKESVNVCYGADYMYPDGTIESAITSNTSHVSDMGSGTGGCDSLIETTLIVNPQVNVVATQAGVTFAANSMIGSYQWVNCDDNFSFIAGATNQSYTASSNGHYACIVTEYGCQDTTTCFEADFTIAPEMKSKEITIYPNPAKGYITLNNLDMNSEMIIYNVQGQIVYHNYVTKAFQIIDVGAFMPGVYTLQISNLIGDVQTFKVLLH